jgi:hypothetical protein
MVSHLLKLLSVGVVITPILFVTPARYSSAIDFPPLPTKAHPLLIALKKNQVLIYTEINVSHWEKPCPHWGVVSQSGELSYKAIFSAYSPNSLLKGQRGGSPNEKGPVLSLSINGFKQNKVCKEGYYVHVT